MPLTGSAWSFAGSLTREQMDAVREYVIFRANQDKAAGVK